jgi:hypothetical protein
VKERSLTEFFDEVVAIPALYRAQVDSDDGVLPPERRAMIRDGVRAMLEDLADDAAAAASSKPEHAAKPGIEGPPEILRNELDEAAESLLVHLLRAKHSVRVGEALPAKTLVSNSPGERLFEQADLVCLSLISTTSSARARYLVRRQGIGRPVGIGPRRASGHAASYGGAGHDICDLIARRR